ncbi:MAG: WD40 repeat domain-containing protein [Candidatus Poribacteria bacterium]|nr:WD40 repeat domain-containing protein [Candidatus Poribacteria bacterium]
MENRQSQTTTQSTQTNSDVTTWELPEGAIARFGQGLISGMAFSPDNALLAVGTRVGVWMYELDTMQPVTLLETEGALISNVVLSPDGKWIATSDGKRIKVREIETQQRAAKIQGWHGGTSRLAFSPDSQYIAASGYEYGDVYVWCTKTGQHVTSFEVRVTLKEGERPPARFPICFSPDAELLAYVSGRTNITVRNLKTKECFADLKHDLRESEYVYDLVFSPCRQFLAASLQDPTTREHVEVQVWNIDKETLQTTYTDYGGTRVVLAYSADGALRVADVYEDKVVMWDASRGEKLDTIEYPGTRGHRIEQCISTDGQQFAILTNRDIRVWRAGAPTIVAPLTVPHHVPDSLFFYQSGKRLVCKYWNEEVVFWDVAQKQVIPPPIPPKSRGKRCALSPCEELLALIGEDGQTLEVWNITSGIQIAELTEHQRSITTVVFSPSGEYLVSGDTDGKLVVWNIHRWEKQHAFIGHAEPLRAAAFHPNGKQFATVDRASIFLWDVTSGEQLGAPSREVTLADASLYKGDSREIQRRCKPQSRVREQYSIAFSPCGTFLAGGLFGDIRLWDVATLEPCMGVILPESCSRVGVVVFSPSGRYLASGSWWNKTDKVSVRLWDVATGKNIHTFWGHTSDVQNLAFSKSGELLASSSYDGTVLLWDIKPFMDS